MSSFDDCSCGHAQGSIYIHTKVVVLEAKVLEVRAIMKKLYSSVCEERYLVVE